MEARLQAACFGSGCSFLLSQGLFIPCFWGFLPYSAFPKAEILLSIQTSSAYILFDRVDFVFMYCLEELLENL